MSAPSFVPPTYDYDDEFDYYYRKEHGYEDYYHQDYYGYANEQHYDQGYGHQDY